MHTPSSQTRTVLHTTVYKSTQNHAVSHFVEKSQAGTANVKYLYKYIKSCFVKHHS